MFDHRIIPLQNRVLVPMARVLAKRGVRADALSWTGFGLGVVAFGLICANWYLAGLLAIAANRLVDGLDGSVARATLPTDRGAFLDIVLDFAFYTLVPLAFALADPARTPWRPPSSSPALSEREPASSPSRSSPSAGACGPLSSRRRASITSGRSLRALRRSRSSSPCALCRPTSRRSPTATPLCARSPRPSG